MAENVDYLTADLRDFHVDPAEPWQSHRLACVFFFSPYCPF